MTSVICSCGWAGLIADRSDCPGCGDSWHERVTATRLAGLRCVEADPNSPLNRQLRRKLVQLGLVVVRAGASTLTPAGLRVLEVARLDDERRRIIAESVARHADLE